MICAICGQDKEPDEMTDDSICLSCASSLLADDDIDMGFGS